MYKEKILDFFDAFLVDLGRDISALKIAVNARARLVATTYKASFKLKA